ncbi:uncharacterized protein BP01DRAFT_153251 [Aspergillus saccharolyticus JOP 1030-1]|uniref:Uncharacterized protein n=1 Tax=Aspergillus saccharolyticus JOP 1030-1 TaxID=1450539 RepID=A0A318ZMF3_9EURO|nr:hypothetical protein BP01DRAFT_153251 [Aspergillus saccharolyticus JOP 1030-1]PYH48666.1 hypothetical protein BP01DRAFT_153251 [Aspergillus saccharolyticus JOP 1030-1]
MTLLQGQAPSIAAGSFVSTGCIHQFPVVVIHCWGKRREKTPIGRSGQSGLAPHGLKKWVELSLGGIGGHPVRWKNFLAFLLACLLGLLAGFSSGEKQSKKGNGQKSGKKFNLPGGLVCLN